jgi:hypothetical protein
VQIFGEAVPELLAVVAMTGEHDPHELGRRHRRPSPGTPAHQDLLGFTG